MTDPKAVDAVLAEFGMQRHREVPFWGDAPSICEECQTAWPCDAAVLASQLAEARGQVEQYQDPRTRYVRVSDVLVAELTAAPSQPVTIQLEEREGNELVFILTRHDCGQVVDPSVTQVSDERVDSLLDELDAVARDIDSYAYGLPLMNDAGLPNMRTIVRDWLQSTADALIASQQEKTNA